MNNTYPRSPLRAVVLTRFFSAGSGTLEVVDASFSNASTIDGLTIELLGTIIVCFSLDLLERVRQGDGQISGPSGSAGRVAHGVDGIQL